MVSSRALRLVGFSSVEIVAGWCLLVALLATIAWPDLAHGYQADAVVSGANS